MAKQHRCHEYKVVLSGTAQSDFTMAVNQPAASVEEAIQLVKGKVKRSKLDILGNSTLQIGVPVVRTVRVDQVVPPGK